jgi:hypothetical protein
LICLNPLADANVICGASEEQKMICLKETENRFNKKDCNNESFFILQELINPIVTTDERKSVTKKHQSSEPYSTPEYINRSKILLGLLYAEGCGIEKNLYKAEEQWISVIEDPWQKRDPSSETSYIDGNEITSVTNMFSTTVIKAREYLKKYSTTYGFPGGDKGYLKSKYRKYFFIRECHKSNELYISFNDFEKAKKSMRIIDDIFKSKGMDTDKIYRDAENDWSSITNANAFSALFNILSLTAIPSSEMITECNIAFKTLTNMRGSNDSRGIKDF